MSELHQTVVGIHLSGPNAKKSAVCLLKVHNNLISYHSLYEKIGSSSTLFSDDRILGILAAEKEATCIVVDCPLSEPPCVACVRPSCPGVIRCEDVEVAQILLAESKRDRQGRRKLRPFNPQSQRLWDVVNFEKRALFEPTYSANMAPLVVRAKTLGKRLKHQFPDISYIETHVPTLAGQLGQTLGYSDFGSQYRNFDRGSRTRKDLLESLSSLKVSNSKNSANSAIELPHLAISSIQIDSIVQSVETFHAFLCAWLGTMKVLNRLQNPPMFMQDRPGWVYTLGQ